MSFYLNNVIMWLLDSDFYYFTDFFCFIRKFKSIITNNNVLAFHTETYYDDNDSPATLPIELLFVSLKQKLHKFVPLNNHIEVAALPIYHRVMHRIECVCENVLLDREIVLKVSTTNFDSLEHLLYLT